MDSIGGYRIIRKLGSGTRADVFLGHSEHAQDSAERLAAIKVFRADATARSIQAEIAALSSIDSPHVVRLLDLASATDNNPCLILQRLEPGGLARLLARRETLSAGEAVTIVAPIADALHLLHRRGIVHGNVSALAVLFDGTGAPVLTGFGAAGFIAGAQTPITPAVLDTHSGVTHDLECLRVLVDSVVARVGEPGPSIEGFLHWVRQPAGTASQFPAKLAERLFALADPLPIGFDADPPGQAALPRRWGVVQAIPADTAPDAAGLAQGAARVEARSWLARLPIPAHRLLPQALDAVQRRVDALRTAAGSVRRRVWAVALIPAAAILAAIVLVPVGSGQEPLPGASEPVATAAGAATEESAVVGDDPLAAAGELLTARAACLRDRSVLCLDGVDQAGSAAWEADAGRIRELQQGAELVLDPVDPDSKPTLVERMGDLALLALAPGGAGDGAGDGHGAGDGTADKAAASVLMVRTEAGWRFRSLLVGEARVVD